MAKLIIFQITSPESDDVDIINEIMNFPNYVRVADSSWVVATNEPCDQINERLSEYMNEGDRLLVADLEGFIAWTSPECGSDALIDVLRTKANDLQENYQKESDQLESSQLESDQQEDDKPEDDKLQN